MTRAVYSDDCGRDVARLVLTSLCGIEINSEGLDLSLRPVTPPAKMMMIANFTFCFEQAKKKEKKKRHILQTPQNLKFDLPSLVTVVKRIIG